MVLVNFKGKIRDDGNSWCVTIPKAFMDNQLLLPKKKYLFIVKEVETPGPTMLEIVSVLVAVAVLLALYFIR